MRAAIAVLCLVVSAPVEARPARVDAVRAMQRTRKRPEPRGGIVQLTGKRQRVGQTIFRKRAPADPFVDVLPDGRVRVYGTSQRYLEFASLEDMLRGGPHRLEKFSTDQDLGWDVLVHRWKDGTEVLYGGVTRPTGKRTRVRWPADNWTRRIYAFTKDSRGRWVRHPRPLFGDLAPDARPRQVGHAYGHHFLETPDGQTWLLHEEVSEAFMTPDGLRHKTEIFARRMIDPYTASRRRIKLVGVDAGIGRNAIGDLMIEGPRPFSVRLDGVEYHFISFSSRHYSDDSYDINIAWRTGSPIGEYTPITEQVNGRTELVGFGAELKRRYDLSWLGRAHVVEGGDGSLWAVFHAVNKRIRPDHDFTRAPRNDLEFQRNLYAVPLRVTRGPDGAPRIELLDTPPRRLDRQPVGPARRRPAGGRPAPDPDRAAAGPEA